MAQVWHFASAANTGLTFNRWTTRVNKRAVLQQLVFIVVVNLLANRLL